MKFPVIFILGIFTLVACSNDKKEIEKLRLTVKNDSIDLAKSKNKDSIIASYVNTMGEIQDNLDSLRIKENLLSLSSNEGNLTRRDKMRQDIKVIDDALIEDNRKINKLESLLKKMRHNDSELNKTVAKLTREITQKNKDIAKLQNQLSLADDSLIALTHRFNDSLQELKKQRGEYSSLTADYNTVYYLVGTMKELKEKGVITKSGGLLGIGRTSELSQTAKASSFIKGDMTKLTNIPLNGKFSKLITSHPSGSYKMVQSGKAEILSITNPSTFWSESKYLIVQIK